MIFLHSFKEEMERLLAFFAHEKQPEHMRFAVAFSGGPDSTALLYLMSQWCQLLPSTSVVALSVNHNLRTHSEQEMHQCSLIAHCMRVPHYVFHWEHDNDIKGNVQANARDARYKLLHSYCKANDIRYLCVGHHASDQVETFFLRLKRGSGVDGLSSIKSLTYNSLYNIYTLRPFLSFTKEELVNTLYACGFYKKIVLDPSNQNMNFDRVKIREKRQLIEQELGIPFSRVQKAVQNIARTNSFVHAYLKDFSLQHVCTSHVTGSVYIDITEFMVIHEEIQLKLLAYIVKFVGVNSYVPRFSSIQKLHTAITRSLLTKMTLGGVVCTFWKNRILFYREFSKTKLQNIQHMDFLHKHIVFDKRFSIYNSTPSVKISVAPLQCFAFLRKTFPCEHPLTLGTLPGIYDYDAQSFIGALSDTQIIQVDASNEAYVHLFLYSRLLMSSFSSFLDTIYISICRLTS